MQLPDGQVQAVCQFCNRHYDFGPAEVGASAGADLALIE